VVKVVHRPVVEAVAPRTIGHAAFFKLLLVRIFMAGMASSGESGKFSMFMFGIGHVAGPAILPDVGALQLKLCLGVVEPVFGSPAFGGMAVFAGLVGVPFNVNFTYVNVFMAIHTALANFSELPLLFFPMAGITGRCDMRSGKCKFSLGMFFKGECASRKPVYGMAFRAVRRFYSGFKLPLVVIFVAGCAGVVGQWIRKAF